MARYAQATSVSTDASISKIRKTIRRYGASEFAHMEGDSEARIVFTMRDRRVMFRLTMPDPKSKEFHFTPSRGTRRSTEQAFAAWEQACRAVAALPTWCVEPRPPASRSGRSPRDRPLLHGEGEGGMRLVRVVAPHFVAGFKTDGIVRRAAPILRYAIGWTDDRARSYFAGKGWKASVVPPASSGRSED